MKEYGDGGLEWLLSLSLSVRGRASRDRGFHMARDTRDTRDR